MDALLGAAGRPNIGVLFSDGAESNRGRSSLEMLREVLGLVEEGGLRVGNVDLVIQLERPRLNPFLGAMRESLAGALGIGGDRVGIKATTAEGLGPVGEGRAMEVICVCLLQVAGGRGDGRIS
jgi:2-C-methyl-D-erythritol 2,4-cyclodiphosphate synthase